MLSPGQSPQPSITARRPVTVACACGRGVSYIPKYGTTRGEAAADPCPSWSARSSWSRGRASATGRESAGAEGFVAVVARTGGNGAGSRSHLALIPQALRPGTHLPISQAEHGMDHPSGAPPRTGRPLELVGGGRLHTAEVGAGPCCGPAFAVGTPLRGG